MKVMVLLGTRPEIIRLSQTIKRLQGACELVLVHTGQNYDPDLSDVFFQELGLSQPDIDLDIRATTFGQQVGQIFTRVGQTLSETRPDRLLILGDTNSGLSAVVAARMGIPVYHMEAGNRCFDDRVPEEINRRVIDHCSAIVMPYTHRSKEHLLCEGIQRQRIFVIGNPIFEVLRANAERIEASDVLERLDVGDKEYFLATFHRSENVDDVVRLGSLLSAISKVADTYQQPMVVSLHPRTADRLQESGLQTRSKRVRLLKPLGLADFVKLERSARCVLSDSGTVQEECCILNVHSVTMRDVTERAETVECGSAILAGSDPETILQAVDLCLGSPCDWTPPAEYTQPNVSRTVAHIVLGHQHLPGRHP